MSELSQSLVFPRARNKQEEELYTVLQTYFNDITKILDGGIVYSDNFDVDIVSFTSDAVADSEDTVSHDLGKVPTGFHIINRDKAGILYDSGTSWTSSNIYLKSNLASTTYKIIVF